MMRKPCADGVANFVTSFDEVDAGVCDDATKLWAIYVG